jgi:hypothetical protein
MDLSLILDPPVNLNFGNLADRDLRDLFIEIGAYGTDPVLTPIARALDVAVKARARGRYVPVTLKLPKVAPEQRKKTAERARHLVEAMTGRASLQAFLCEVCLALLLDRPARGSKNIRLACVGYAERITLANRLLDEE